MVYGWPRGPSLLHVHAWPVLRSDFTLKYISEICSPHPRFELLSSPLPLLLLLTSLHRPNSSFHGRVRIVFSSVFLYNTVSALVRFLECCNDAIGVSVSLVFLVLPRFCHFLPLPLQTRALSPQHSTVNHCQIQVTRLGPRFRINKGREERKRKKKKRLLFFSHLASSPHKPSNQGCGIGLSTTSTSSHWLESILFRVSARVTKTIYRPPLVSSFLFTAGQKSTSTRFSAPLASPSDFNMYDSENESLPRGMFPGLAGILTLSLPSVDFWLSTTFWWYLFWGLW